MWDEGYSLFFLQKSGKSPKLDCDVQKAHAPNW